jgi:hypothetical protein
MEVKTGDGKREEGDTHAMLQGIFARFIGLVVGVDLHHDFIEILDNIFDLVCKLSVSFV